MLFLQSSLSLSLSVTTLWLLAAIAAVSTTTVAAAGAEDAGGIGVGVGVGVAPSWTIYHSWKKGGGHEDYTRRGILRWDEEDQSMQVTNDDGALTKENVQAMLDYGWYHVKIEFESSSSSSSSSSTSKDKDFVMATVPACNLRRANFKDEFSLILPRTTSQSKSETQITSLSYAPLVSPLAPATCEDLELSQDGPPLLLVSKVNVALDTPGMPIRPVLPHAKPPPGLSFLTHPNAKKGSAAGAGGGDPNAEPGGDEPPQSFLRRYWYVILPLVLANFMGSGSAEEEAPAQEGAAGEGSSSGGGGQPIAAAAKASSSSPSKKSARRGKRG